MSDFDKQDQSVGASGSGRSKFSYYLFAGCAALNGLTAAFGLAAGAFADFAQSGLLGLGMGVLALAVKAGMHEKKVKEAGLSALGSAGLGAGFLVGAVNTGSTGLMAGYLLAAAVTTVGSVVLGMQYRKLKTAEDALAAAKTESKPPMNGPGGMS